MDLELLQERAAIFRAIRSFFDNRNYLELDTPLLAPDLIPESCLEVFETSRIKPRGEKEAYWLIPSPEIWMKPLIAEHRSSVYQICHCFRNGESSGHLHSPEFTMLEYYTMDADYRNSLGITEELLGNLGNPLFKPPFLRIPMEEAFREWAGFSLFDAAEGGSLGEEARRLGLDPPPDLGTEALYDLIFIHAVEPRLPKDRVVALMDYPAFVPCLAQRGKDGRTMERWELYVQGIELANCYSEATDPLQIRRFLESEGAKKQQEALVPHRVNPRFLEQGLPRCSGVALGLDRLVMALTGRSRIDSVIPFPM